MGAVGKWFLLVVGSDLIAGIQTLRHYAVMKPEPEPGWMEAQRLQRKASLANLAGLYSSKLWIIIPPLATAMVGALIGDGPYLILILAVLWGVLGWYGLKVRKTSELRTERRSRGFWIACWSFMLSALTFAMGLVFLLTDNGA